MRIRPDNKVVFVEIPKTASTAASTHLRHHGWKLNGERGEKRLPGTVSGRHSRLSDEARDVLRAAGARSYAVVRNPFDRAASMWRAHATKKSWSLLHFFTRGNFMHGEYNLLRDPQTLWTEHVDNVMRYETLDRDWNDMLDLPIGPLPRVNTSQRRASPDWTPEEVALVRDIWAADFKAFGYSDAPE